MPRTAVRAIAWLGLFRVFLVPFFLHLNCDLREYVSPKMPLNRRMRNLIIPFCVTLDLFIHDAASKDLDMNSATLGRQSDILVVKYRQSAELFYGEVAT